VDQFMMSLFVATPFFGMKGRKGRLDPSTFGSKDPGYAPQHFRTKVSMWRSKDCKCEVASDM